MNETEKLQTTVLVVGDGGGCKFNTNNVNKDSNRNVVTINEPPFKF